MLGFLLRDTILVGLSLALWWLLAPYSAGEGLVADFSGWVAGIALFVCAYLGHEWSHYLGALLSGSRVRAGERLTSAFLFSFDSEGNSLAQFVTMSLAGFAATALLVVAYVFFLPDEYLASRIARGGVLFLAFLGIVLELPLLLAGVFQGAVPRQASVQAAPAASAGPPPAPAGPREAGEREPQPQSDDGRLATNVKVLDS
ncbi:MAG: hypothetical protein JRF61_09850 [Deltaproteobacteria bacterium]|nr:hypothetical protein [Deltaproteobacteria bacterium]